MESTENIVNETLFKLIFFRQMIVPNSPKICNINVYRFVIVTFSIITQCLVIYGLLGHIMWAENKVDDITKCQILFALACNIQCVVMIFTLLCKADDVWRLSTVTRVNFLTSAKCRRNISILRKYRNLSRKIEYLFVSLTIIDFLCWVTFPLVFNAQQPDAKDICDNVRRYENVLNFQFPVTTMIYNDYYLMFYAMELIITFWLTYVNMIYSVFFISFSFAIIAQYEVITRTFENVGSDLRIDENVDGKLLYYKNLL